MRLNNTKGTIQCIVTMFIIRLELNCKTSFKRRRKNGIFLVADISKCEITNYNLFCVLKWPHLQPQNVNVDAFIRFSSMFYLLYLVDWTCICVMRHLKSMTGVTTYTRANHETQHRFNFRTLPVKEWCICVSLEKARRMWLSAALFSLGLI